MSRIFQKEENILTLRGFASNRDRLYELFLRWSMPFFSATTSNRYRMRMINSLYTPVNCKNSNGVRVLETSRNLIHANELGFARREAHRNGRKVRSENARSPKMSNVSIQRLPTDLTKTIFAVKRRNARRSILYHDRNCRRKKVGRCEADVRVAQKRNLPFAAFWFSLVVPDSVLVGRSRREGSILEILESSYHRDTNRESRTAFSPRASRVSD